jgi:hypothetical protein
VHQPPPRKPTSGHHSIVTVGVILFHQESYSVEKVLTGCNCHAAAKGSMLCKHSMSMRWIVELLASYQRNGGPALPQPGALPLLGEELPMIQVDLQ